MAYLLQYNFDELATNFSDILGLDHNFMLHPVLLNEYVSDQSIEMM